MSEGRTERPCESFMQGGAHMGGLCGRCAWPEQSHEDYRNIPDNVTITTSKPEIFDRIREKWGVRWEDGHVVLVYGDKIHKSFTHEIELDLLMHELVHVKQQANYPGGAAAWWERYLEDVEFRISQELEAYRTQYKYCVENYQRNARKAVLKHSAKALSSNLYGNSMNYTEAYEQIRNYE